MLTSEDNFNEVQNGHLILVQDWVEIQILNHCGMMILIKQGLVHELVVCQTELFSTVIIALSYAVFSYLNQFGDLTWHFCLQSYCLI